MSGYTGRPDDEAEHALILAENALHAARQNLYTSEESATECEDCGEIIPEARRKAMPGVYQCILCRSLFEKTMHKQKIKMLDRVL
jgi:phage/conjugal plasmid C-4 type zinc finger TraR family protein